MFASPIASRTWNGNIYYTKPGCISPKIPVTLTVNPTPTVSINASTNPICEGSTVTITAGGADTYTWNTASNNISIIESPTVSTSYTVNAESNLCPNEIYSNTITINVNALPSVSLTTASSTICSGSGSIALTGSPAGGTYSGTAVTGSLLSIANPGTFVPVYTYTDSGSGCSNTASITVYVFNCTTVDESGNTQVSAINIYPNPNNGSFIVDTKTFNNKQINIVDITGKVVLSTDSSDDKIKIDISNYSKGMYFVIIKSEKTTSTIKVVKE
ncbi:MAG: T9SS type A sorting domain-containing protein [Bacteroidia bacterium]